MSSSTATAAHDAGVSHAPAAQGDLDAGDPSAATQSETQCSADLATCLLANPLGYAECLRSNAEHHCPEPNTGTATTSTVTTEDGKPLSMACQAELATCIMRFPTPENAETCTEMARKCK